MSRNKRAVSLELFPVLCKETLAPNLILQVPAAGASEASLPYYISVEYVDIVTCSIVKPLWCAVGCAVNR